MLIRFCTKRSILSATIVVCAICIGTICVSRANSHPKSTWKGTYLIENFAIYRHLGDGVYKVDATPLLELAREIVKDDKSSIVSFDESSQSLFVTSTQENLQRLGTRIANMYRAIGVELEPEQRFTSMLSTQTK